MPAFVPSSGLGAVRTPLLSSYASAICGTRLAAAPATSARLNGAAGAVMTGDYGITLQTLVYSPNPVVSGVEDKDLLCRMVWKQVFGNAYVMESEKADAYIAESMFRAGRITIKEFVRACALCATYRRRFFECCGPYRTVELSIKHLLGRGPLDQREISYHVQTIANNGYEAHINSIIDSEEYDAMFGEDCVPFMTFKGTYRTIEEFNRMCAINSSPGTTDKSLTGRARALGIDNPNHVLSLDGAGVPSKMVSNVAVNGRSAFIRIIKGIPSRPDLEHGQQSLAGLIQPTVVINDKAAPRKRYEISPGSYMYLTPDEASEYGTNTSTASKVADYAQQEVLVVKAQMAELEAKLEQLSLLS